MNEIFHYTSFETFKKIIESGSIRFNSLKNVDDAEEGFLLDTGSQAPYTFVSCWTKSSAESIPLWSMYVDSPFALRIGVSPEFISPVFFKKHFLSNHKNRNAYVCLIHRGGVRGKEFLSEIEYKDQPLVQMYKNLRGFVTDDYIEKYGLTKSKYWEFQDEVRYIVQAAPLSSIKPRPNASLYTFFQEAIINCRKTDINHIDIEYLPEHMRNANIMLGPSTSSKDEEELRSYLSENLPSFRGNISRSEVVIRPKERI